MMISTRLHGVIDYAVAALFSGLSASRSLPLPVRGVPRGDRRLPRELRPGDGL